MGSIQRGGDHREMLERELRRACDGMAHQMPKRDVIRHVPHYLCECQPVLMFRSAHSGMEFWTHHRLRKQPN